MKRKSKQGFSCVYTLYSLLTGQVYIGFTNDFKKRLLAHHQGQVPSTTMLRPLQLLGMEYFTCRTDALKREAYLKTENGQRHVRFMFSEAISNYQRKRQEIRKNFSN